MVVSKSPLPTMWPSESAPSGLAALATQDYTDSGLVEYFSNTAGEVKQCLQNCRSDSVTFCKRFHRLFCAGTCNIGDTHLEMCC